MMPLLLTWQEHMVCQVILGTILIQNRNFRDLSGLVDSLGAKMTLRAKFRDVNGNYADVLCRGGSSTGSAGARASPTRARCMKPLLSPSYEFVAIET